MRAPRELLLERHRHADPELGAIRRRVIAQECRDGARTSSHWVQLWATRLWSELILPYRRAWLGLAAAWALIAGLNLMRESFPGDHAPNLMSGSGRAATAVILAEQGQLRAELLGLDEQEPAAPRPADHLRRDGPRSEQNGRPDGPRSAGIRAPNRHACLTESPLRNYT